MDDKKKLIGLVAVIVLALIGAAIGFRQSGVAGEQIQEVGSLEGGVNKATGMPLNPPPAQGTPPQADPSGGQ